MTIEGSRLFKALTNFDGVLPSNEGKMFSAFSSPVTEIVSVILVVFEVCLDEVKNVSE